MVFHERPDNDSRPLNSYVYDPTQRMTVEMGITLLSQFPTLKVWETQCPSTRDYTCYYVSFQHKETPWILNFTMYPKYANVEFRYPQYLPDAYLDGLNWITSNWAYIRFTDNSEKLKEMLDAYITAIRTPFDNGLLKQGGKSFAEQLISNLLKIAYTNIQLQRNVRPDWLRSSKGKPIELDILIPEWKVAIEVQGPQHFNAIYGDAKQHESLVENDLLKKRRCQEQGVRLIWMDVEGINKSLIRVPLTEKVRIIQAMISDFGSNNLQFMFWKNPKERIVE